jgi:flagellar assembly factor FliW
VKAATIELPVERKPETQYRKDTLIRFEEGLIGFAEAKNFVLIEEKDIAPLRLMQSAGSSHVNFLVLDPRVRIADYYDQIPAREWEALGITDPSKRLAFVIVNIGLNAKESTGNFQAPILVNYETMRGRQVILTDSGFCLRHPLAG